MTQSDEADLGRQARARRVGEAGIHLDEVRRRGQLREHVVEERVAVPGAAQVARPDEQPLAGLRHLVEIGDHVAAGEVRAEVAEVEAAAVARDRERRLHVAER